MNDKPAFWFPVKRYGWGWRRDSIGSSVSVLVLTAALVVIVAIKGDGRSHGVGAGNDRSLVRAERTRGEYPVRPRDSGGGSQAALISSAK
jgi:hypothetical protein